jgi:hypothetical protein
MEISHAHELNQYCENAYTTKSNLHIQCNPYQNSNEIYHRDWKINLKVHLKAQKTMNSPSNTDQKVMLEISYQLQTILQSRSNKNSMVMAQKHTWRQVDRTEDPDMNPHSCTHLIFDKGAQNKCCWENWISACRKWNEICICHPVQVSTQNGLRTLV